MVTFLNHYQYFDDLKQIINESDSLNPDFILPFKHSSKEIRFSFLGKLIYQMVKPKHNKKQLDIFYAFPINEIFLQIWNFGQTPLFKKISSIMTYKFNS